MPGGDGLDAAAELHAALPSCRIVILMTFGRPGYLARAMRAGASGFVVKDAPPEQLVDAVRRVHAGLRVVDPVLAAESLSTGASPLTERERDVLRAAADGATVATVAARLHLSEGTVRNHRRRPSARPAAHTRAEAVRLGRRARLAVARRRPRRSGAAMPSPVPLPAPAGSGRPGAPQLPAVARCPARSPPWGRRRSIASCGHRCPITCRAPPCSTAVVRPPPRLDSPCRRRRLTVSKTQTHRRGNGDSPSWERGLAVVGTRLGVSGVGARRARPPTPRRPAGLPTGQCPWPWRPPRRGGRTAARPPAACPAAGSSSAPRRP